MRVVWTTEAMKSYYETLDYWDEHNGSNSYSIKIMTAIDVLIKELVEDPYFLGQYDEQLNLHRRTILKGRFLIYYEIKDAESTIAIQYFRSSYQKPLSSYN